MSNDTKTPTVKESDIQAAICEYLDRKGFFFWRTNNIPVFDTRRGVFRSLPKYTPRGLADIIVLYKGRMVALEVKRPGNRAVAKHTPEQIHFGDLVERNGGIYGVVRSIDDAERILCSL